MSICCKKVDLVFAFNDKHCVWLEALGTPMAFLWRWIGRKEGDLNLRMSLVAIPNCLARLLGCICWLCRKFDGEAVCVCGGAALTRSPKNTSLMDKEVRSHSVFPLIHTALARTVPVVKSTRLGNTKLRYQLPGSHYISQGRTRLNWITLSQLHAATSIPVASSPDRVQ